jgi:integrase/recombinase XerD
VLDENLAVVDDADAFLRHVRFGRDGSELTTRSYAGGIALFLRWCARKGRHWHDGVAALGLFVTWLRHAGPQASGVDVVLRFVPWRCRPRWPCRSCLTRANTSLSLNPIG